MDNANSQQKTNILDIIQIFLHYWLLLLIFVVIFVAAGVIYLKFASKTYSVFARIAITMDLNSSNRGSNAYVNVSDLMSQEKDFANEIAFLRSTPLLVEVINDMNLFTSYYIKEDKIPKEFVFSLNNIYKDSPFIVVVDESSLQPVNVLFYLSILDDETYLIGVRSEEAKLYNFANGSISREMYLFELEGIYKFGEDIKTPYCSFKLLLNSNYKSERYQGKDLFFKFDSPQDLASRFQNKLSVRSAFYESSIADLSFEGENLEMAMDFLNILITKYIEKNLEKKNYNANNTIEYIDRQLATISGSLGQSEQDLQFFRSSRDVMDINDKVSSISGQILALEQTRDNFQTEFNNLSQLSDYFEANKDQSTFIAPSYMGMSDATLATLIQELTALSSEKQSLISTNQLRNPRLKTLEANITTIKNVIADNINFNLSTTRNKLEEINSRLKLLYNESSRLPQTQRQLVGLEREFNINDAVYTSLLDKRIQAQIIKASNLPDCEIIEPVRFVEVASPSAKKILVIAMFLGVMFPSIYIIIINFLSQRIRSREDIRKICSLPIIGSIPHTATKPNNLISLSPQSPLAEKFHSMQSNLIYYSIGESNKTILVTSTLPGEGKSFISLNLAMSFALTDNKTILVSFDLRKANPSLSDLEDKGKPWT